MFTHKAYIIKTLTNTHVGAGDTEFGIVDNLIQRDPVRRLPVFHSSSLKGALREHMEAEPFLDKDCLKLIFGNKTKSENLSAGEVKFYEARLLALPLRSSTLVYHNATAPFVFLDFLETLSTFGITGDDTNGLKTLFKDIKNKFEKKDSSDFCVFGENNRPIIEDFEKSCVCNGRIESLGESIKALCNLQFDNLAVFKDDLFKQICESSIPVIARNSLDEQGISQNLFYEEVLPRQTTLWFMLGRNKKYVDEQCYENFENKLINDLIQIGANASIGYGVTRISSIYQGSYQ